MKAALLLPTALLLGALTAAAGSSMPALPGGWQGKLGALLPGTGQLATIMTWQPSLSTVQLQIQVARAGGSPEALQTVIVSAAQGKRAPYDERLGISEEQYRTYLVFQPVLVSTGKTVKLPVVRDSARVTFGESPQFNSVLRGVTIDLKTGELRVPEGFTARPASVNPGSSADLDIRSGFQWTIRGSNAAVGNGVRGTFQLLQLENNQVILRYQRTSMIRRVINEGDIILQYAR